MEFYHIAETGDFKRLQLKGEYDKNGCAEAWEEILKYNAEATNSLGYNKYKEQLRQHTRIANEYQLIKGYLISLLVAYDEIIIKELNTKGYRIYNQPSGNREEDTRKYTDSILNASKRVENLRSKCASLAYEMEQYSKSLGNKKDSFNKRIADLIFELPGLSNPEAIKLSTYNELVTKINQRKRPVPAEKNNG